MSTRYTVEKRDGCTLIHGAVPASDLAALMLGAAKDDPEAVLDTDLARMAKANLAFGNRRDVEALKAALAADTLAQVKRAHPNLGEAAVQWLATGEQDQSALAIFDATVEAGVADADRRGAYPHDPDDLRRCRLLLEQVPEAQAGFDVRMREVSLAWQSLAMRWPDLCVTMDDEAPEWRSRLGTAPETYRLMRSILDPIERRPSPRRP